MFIDTHVHLNNKELESHLKEVLDEAYQADVKRMIVVGYDLETSIKAVELASKIDGCYAAVGFHPTEIKNYTDEEYEKLEILAQNKKVLAIGEVGYDFHWDTTTKEEQKEAFIRQIELAKKLNLPLIIHSRDAHQITYETLKNTNDLTVHQNRAVDADVVLILLHELLPPRALDAVSYTHLDVYKRQPRWCRPPRPSGGKNHRSCIP